MTVHLTAADYGAVLPEIIVLTGALVLMLLDVLLPRRRVEATTGVALLALALAFVASAHLWIVDTGPAFPHGLGAMITSDRFAQFFNFALLISSALAILLSPPFVRTSHFDPGEFFALILFATSGMMLMAAGINLIVLFLSIELLSLSLYILSGFDRSRPRSQEAGFKYFLLSSFASAFLVYGMALVYGATGTTALRGIVRCLGGHACHGAVSSPFVLIGIALMAVGFSFKISIVPFHMWTPDVYEGAPTPVTAFMSVATKAAVFAAFLRVFNYALGSESTKWFGILWALAIVTMVVGNVLALSQTNMKRMLAYSGIAHAGYVLVAMSSTNRLGVTAVAFYFLVYAFMNVGAFVVVLVLESRGEVGDEIRTYSGLFSRSPLLASATAIFMFSLAGFPPTAGFFAKYYAFAAAVQAGHTELAIIGVLTSVVSLVYYLRVVVVMFMQPAEAGEPSVRPAWTSQIALASSVAGTMIVGIVPWFYNLALQAVQSIFHYTS
ncbi:MAG TPA: NADH-quinone oxidoreductase subunit N [Chloroflexota bacterium]|nr:NADH-quinone oxidoreductase subunit N [Chloroflexota bacterium]